MSDHYKLVSRLNRILLADLGNNPRYAWRWSEDLRHVMYKVDDLGNPEYTDGKTATGLYVQKRATAIRPLLPFHPKAWVCCALIEVDQKDGELAHTGMGSWVPVSSSRSGPAALPQGVLPDAELTQAVVAAVKAQRERTVADEANDWEDLTRKREIDRWRLCYDIIRDSAPAFNSVPGRKGRVSFGGVTLA